LIHTYTPLSSSPESYAETFLITAKNGATYALRDCSDFRPRVTDASIIFCFRQTQFLFIIFLLMRTLFTADYSYYLARKDKLVLSKDKNFEVIEGTPSVTPLSPIELDGSLVIANLTLDPYTSYVPSEAPRGIYLTFLLRK
jgi:hypothetical protein